MLSDFCSAMRCMPRYGTGQTLTFVQDRPSDVWTYNRSNVVMPDDGAPFHSFSALKDRHNAVEVNWIDRIAAGRRRQRLNGGYARAIARYGRNVTKMDAFGCTASRGQAHRAGAVAD
ncbi:phage tail protein [Escherichia coli]|uniref:phage tail protein n=1 Tax=Escherichia coli TaxID=562 RepID=UPI00388E5218